MKSTQILLLALAAGLLVVFGISLSDNLSQYSHFVAAQETGRQVHIPGEWVRRSEAIESENSFSFYMKDTLQNVEMVHYYDPKPSNFDMADRVVLVGQYRDEGFVADQIITKCPSKYGESEVKIQ